MLTSLENIKNKIENGSYDARFSRIYLRSVKEKKRYLTAVNEFEKYFGSKNAFIISVPTQITLASGKNTLLAAADELDTVAVAAKRDDGKINVRFANGEFSVDISELGPRADEKGTPSSIIRGIAAGFSKWELTVGGFDVYVDNARTQTELCTFEVLIGTLLAYLYNDDSVAQYKIALISVKAQNEYYGSYATPAPALVCAMGGILKLDLTDKDAPDFKKLIFEPEKNGYVLCTVNANVRARKETDAEILCDILDGGDFESFLAELRNQNKNRRQKAFMLCKRILGKKGALNLCGNTLQAYVPAENYKKFKKEAETVFGKNSVRAVCVRECGAAFFA